jgi:hypothetical protein
LDSWHQQSYSNQIFLEIRKYCLWSKVFKVIEVQPINDNKMNLKNLSRIQKGVHTHDQKTTTKQLARKNPSFFRG